MSVRRLASCLALASLLLTGSPAPAQDSGQIESRIESRRSEADAGKGRIEALTKKERGLYRDLAKVEDAMREMQGEIGRKERALAELGSRIAAAEADHSALAAQRGRTVHDLSLLLRSLWPQRIQALAGASALSDLGAWEEADRRSTWLASLADQSRAKLDLLGRQTAKLRQNIELQSTLRADAEIRLAQVNQAKDGLLADKLAYLRGIQEVRAKRLTEEQSLGQVMAAIEDLKYRLKALEDRKFPQFKGRLALPAAGKVVAHPGSSEGGGRPGVGLSSSAGTEVRSVFWGKVVHNDLLRGFGQVVIVYHGEEYYSLYAFLSDTRVRVGQEVEKGESLGSTGFYPPAKGPGLYFELRFGQKAINPEPWFAALN
ncbi:MAG: peptidoglycan DD-metalloendopeptidase family protein [Thermodesulfobacteriota bacterium]